MPDIEAATERGVRDCQVYEVTRHLDMIRDLLTEVVQLQC